MNLVESWKQTSDAFHDKPRSDLYDLVFDYWPEAWKYRAKLSHGILTLAFEASNEAMICLCVTRGMMREGDPVDIENIPLLLNYHNTFNTGIVK